MVCLTLIFSASVTARGSELTLSPEDRLLVIRTLTPLGDGGTIENRGSGVRLGGYYLTVYHNLDPRFRAHRVGEPLGRSYLGQEPVSALIADPDSDIAILRLPTAICGADCTARPRAAQRLPELGETVRWFLGAADSPSGREGWQSGHILSRTLNRPSRRGTGGSDADDCSAGLVFEVSTPFIPGSSGTAVWSVDGELLGIGQGSYEREGGPETGYFRPWRCIQDRWPVDLVGISSPSTGSVVP
ncbi:MAG: serine protease [Pseudomonadota bacterium]